MRERVIGPPPDEGDAPAVSRGHQCLVHGCPPPGTWSSSTTGGPRICFVHDGVDADQWAETTAAIERLETVFRLYAQLINAAPGTLVPDITIAALRTRGFHDLAAMPSSHTTCRQFGGGLRTWLLKQCQPERKERVSIVERLKLEGLRPFGDFA